MPSIMYEIIMTGSEAASGNLSGCLQHSMSKASTRGSPKACLGFGFGLG
jgi:hypothetical protein